jgi:hypothetical protein
MTVSKFKVRDRVYAPQFGYGVVSKIYTGSRGYPIVVTWKDGRNVFECASFTKEGEFVMGMPNEETTIVKVIEKSKSDAVNPTHYRVKGIPEAYDIMAHLMTRKQLEGFLWGNIIKYAYRYGRKGDKAETAGKIAWYATKLKELEVSSEEKEDD